MNFVANFIQFLNSSMFNSFLGLSRSGLVFTSELGTFLILCLFYAKFKNLFNIPNVLQHTFSIQRPPPQAGEKCIGWVEKREKKERKGKNQAKNRKN